MARYKVYEKSVTTKANMTPWLTKDAMGSEMGAFRFDLAAHVVVDAHLTAFDPEEVTALWEKHVQDFLRTLGDQVPLCP